MLTDQDYWDASVLLRCDPAAIRAVAEIEAPGGGFLEDGRPKILFEAHVFHRLTDGKFDATHPNISSPRWDRTLYGKGGAHQWERLELAKTLAPSAALKSASWGKFQIMGENFAACGYASVEEFVENMTNAGEAAHLMAFCHFVLNNSRMAFALRERNWMDFARLYNGPGYASNDYHNKLAKAFDRWTQSPSQSA